MSEGQQRHSDLTLPFGEGRGEGRRDRRSFLLASLGALAIGSATPTFARTLPRKSRVVVVGGGFGGATAAKYLRLLGEGRVEVILVEPDAAFVSCPLSNLVIGGSRRIGDITVPYAALARRHGVTVVHDTVTAIDFDARQVRLARAAPIAYDRLVLSPGVEMLTGEIEDWARAAAAGHALHAWKAGDETLQLRRQLEAMPDGGVFAIAIPEIPYRCPPGPYERACQAAWYLKRTKPRSKVLVLDANPDITSKADLFRNVWADDYPGLVEYRPQYKAVGIDAQAGAIRFEVQDDERADVLNVIPPQRAGRVAVDAGLATLGNKRWCAVDYQTFESTVARDVHVLGDAIQIAPGMPKSGHMANNHGKVAAAAIVARLAGWEPDPEPMLANTCYSFVDDARTVHIASVHRFTADDRTFHPVPGAGGLSAAPSAEEGRIALGWARNIWSDMLA